LNVTGQHDVAFRSEVGVVSPPAAARLTAILCVGVRGSSILGASMNIKALVVDRRSTVRNELSQPLKQIGVQKVVERNANDIGGTNFEAGEFDVIFVEFNTLIEAGETLVQRLRQQDSAVPIIVTYPETTNFGDLKKYCPKATAYLKTPFKTDELAAMVKEQLQLLTA
jgi:DNA-binding NtrC family response regulator